MPQMIVRPIANWPWPRRGGRKRAPFRVSFNRAIQDLDRECAHLKAKQVILELAVDENDIRLSGWIRASARPRTPGVILSIETPDGWMRYPCDTYDDWQGNLRGIILSLAALRAVDRYGVTGRGEQYKGFKALPDSNGSANGGMAKEEAIRIIAACAGHIDDEVLMARDDLRKDAIKKAKFATHPDRNGGDEASFRRVCEAEKVLERP